MVCPPDVIVYDNIRYKGLILAGSEGDGYSINLRWLRALSKDTSFQIAYNVYYSARREDVFAEGVKSVVVDPTRLNGAIVGLAPGDTYWFAVRATSHEIAKSQLNSLPFDDSQGHSYPEAMLLSNIGVSDLEIFVSDVDTFPPIGTVQIGIELIYYTSLDLAGGRLILPGPEGRGVFGTAISIHQTDGYDGVRVRDPLVRHFKGFEDGNTRVLSESNHFEGKYAATATDGYREVESLVTTDLSIVDEANEGFKEFDYGGYRRISPVDMLNGDCIGSYYGGEHYCADGYDGVGRKIRGISFKDHNNQREEVLLSVTGEPVVLVRRQYDGIQNTSVSSIRESPANRHPGGYGTEGTTGYEQFFNERRSDGRIMVRFGPTMEDIVQDEHGRENEFVPDCWTLVLPGIRDRDFIIRFNEDGTEEFRYEILKVTRNRTVLGESGAQKFTARRLRKTDPQYQYRTFRNTATMPQELTTSISSVPGIMVPHMHRIVISENIVSLVQVNQTTSTDRSHNHAIIDGKIISSAGHSHDLILP